MICALLFLQACKKDVQNSSELSVSGFGAVAFASGDAISVYGSGFDPLADNNTVLFNGVKGEVATATPNRLQVIAPVLVSSGKITVTVHGKSVTCAQSYTIVNVLQGTYNDNFILTADKKYLLRGDVVFNSKLSVEPGTIIYGEKATHGSLTAKDIDFSGSADKPIIFTSDQPAGSRFPGDWKGVIIGAENPNNTGTQVPNGIFQYVRIEYAGYHNATGAGSGLNINLTPGSIYKYIQVSYSSGAGITMTALNGGFINHIIAFGCLADDFRVSGTAIKAQFGLGLKDPYFADSFYKGNGITTVGTTNNQFSNFTLVGYNPDARNILNLGPTVNSDAGSGILLGNAFSPKGEQLYASDFIAIYNSVIAASWQSGVAIVSSQNTNLNNYENEGGYARIFIRNCFFAGTSPAQLPVRGGMFGRIDEKSVKGGFITDGIQPKRVIFGQVNDTTKVLSFSQQKDDLGINGLADYSHLNDPTLLPANGSILLKGAIFPSGSDADSPFFDKNVVYIGAFGTEDWTKNWSSFNPQDNKY